MADVEAILKASGADGTPARCATGRCWSSCTARRADLGGGRARRRRPRPGRRDGPAARQGRQAAAGPGRLLRARRRGRLPGARPPRAGLGRHLANPFERHALRQLLQQLAALLASCGRARLGLEVLAHPGPQGVEGLEVAEVFGELVVESRHDALADFLDRHRVGEIRVAHLGDRVVLREVDHERLGLADVHPDRLVVEPGRIDRGADLDPDVLVPVGLRVWARAFVPLEIEDRRVATCDAAPLDGHGLRRTVAQPLEGGIDRRFLDRDIDLLDAERGEVARIDRGHCVERGKPGGGDLTESAKAAVAVAAAMRVFDAETRFYGGNAIVGGGLPIAVGLALADHMQQRPRVTTCFFGDGAVAEGEFHEALNLTALWKLPVLFLCENNLYAMGTRLERAQSQTNLAAKARSYLMPGEPVDGMDVLAVEAATTHAAEAVRRGAGPVSRAARRTASARIRCSTPSSIATNPRSNGGSNATQSRPSPQRFEAQGFATDTLVAALEASVSDEVDQAVQFAEAGDWEPVADLVKDVYTPVARQSGDAGEP